METQYGIVIILQNRKIPTDFYLIAIWQLNPVKDYARYSSVFIIHFKQILKTLL